MARTTCLLTALALAGCSDGGHVDVVVHRIALADAQVSVVFTDPDGMSRTADVDADGHASGEIVTGGTVTLARLIGGSADLTAYTDVQPGSTLEFGPPEVDHPSRGTMTITGDVPPGADQIQIAAVCRSNSTSPGVQKITLDDRCGATVDLLLVGVKFVNPNNVNVAYIYLPAQPIVDGGTIALDPTAWRPPEPITIHIHGADGMFEQPNNSVYLTDSFGVRTYDVRAAHDTVTATMPLAGTFALSAMLTRVPALGQTLYVDLPAVAAQDLDFAGVLAPWVMQHDRSWSVDDVGGALVASALVADYKWTQPIANYTEDVQLRVISAAPPPGKLPFPNLPAPLAKYQPGPDFQIEATARLVRAEGLADIPVARAAEAGTGIGSGPLGGGSLAVTSRF